MPCAPRLLLTCLALSTLAACGPKIRFADSIDQEFDLNFTTRYDSHLHSPYVAGADFRIRAWDATENNDLEGWRLVSRDPAVLEIVDQWVERDDVDEDDNSDSKSDVLVASVQATGEGTAIVEVYDDDDEFVRATEIEVMQPDRVELRAAGPLFIEREDVAPSLVDETPKILAGGTATFLVEWYKGDQRLHGAGALELESAHEAIDDLWERRTLWEEDRDWMTVTVAEGSGGELAPVGLRANGQLVDVRELSIVGPESLAYAELHGERESKADDGDLLVVLAQAFDEDDESVWGVAFDWDLDGVGEPGEGDLFRYWFREDAWSTLGAQYDGIRAEAEIQGVEGYVDSSNDLSCFCSAEPDQPGRGIALGLLGLAALGLVRRRRA